MDDREVIARAACIPDYKADAVLAALKASGRVIVPGEATEAMENAACDLWWLDFEGDEEVYLRVTAQQAHEIYRAMIAAAKEPTDGR